MKRRESFGPGDLAIQNVSTSNLISGGASADYDTLKEIEDKIKQLEAGGVAVDKTLSIENMPADAGAVGELKEDLDEVDARLSESITNNLGVKSDNLYNPQNDTYGYGINSSGALVQNELRRYSELIHLPTRTFISFKTASTATSADGVLFIALYSADGTFRKRYDVGGTDLHEFGGISYDAYIRLVSHRDAEPYMVNYGRELKEYLKYGFNYVDDIVTEDKQNEAITDALKVDVSEDITKNVITQYYINCNYSIGTVINTDSPQKSNAWAYVLTEVKSGDKFEITGEGGELPRLWAFLDKDKKLISVADINAKAVGLILVADRDGYFIVNTNITTAVGYSVKRNVEKSVTNIVRDSMKIKNNVVHIAPIPSKSFVSSDSTLSFDSLTGTNTVYSNIISYIDDAIEGQTDYANKKVLGKDASNSIDIIFYELLQKDIIFGSSASSMSEEYDMNKPKIIIVAGQHGAEKGSQYAIAYLIDLLCNHWAESEVLEYLRFNTDLILIPSANPWGTTNNKQYNYNQVNINRNWDYKFEVEGTKGDDYYSGETAFSEPEVRYIRDLMQDNKNAILCLDYHTNGSSGNDYRSLCWLSVPNESNIMPGDYDNIMYEHIRNMSNIGNKEFNQMQNVDVLFGYASKSSSNGMMKGYGNSIGIPTMTIEASMKLPTESVYHSAMNNRFNTESIINWVTTFLKHI